MNTASASLTARLRSVTKLSLPLDSDFLMIAASPGSKIGSSPFLRHSIFAPLISAAVTRWPICAKQAADTSPTYPVPIIAIRMQHSRMDLQFRWERSAGNHCHFPAPQASGMSDMAQLTIGERTKLGFVPEQIFLPPLCTRKDCLAVRHCLARALRALFRQGKHQWRLRHRVRVTSASLWWVWGTVRHPSSRASPIIATSTAMSPYRVS